MYADGTSGEEAERPVVDERRREAVALVDELLEDRLALAHEHEQPRHRGREPRRRVRPSTVSSSFDARWAPRRENGTRSSPATLSDRSTTRSGRASSRCRTARPGGFRDRGAHAAGGRRVRGGRGASGSSAPARPPPAARSGTTRTGRPPTTRVRRAARTGERVRAEGATAPRARPQRRRSSAAAAGTPTSRSRRRARSSATSTARPGRSARRTSRRESAWASLAAPAIGRTALRAQRCARFRRRTRSATSPGRSRAVSCRSSSTCTSTTRTSLDRAPDERCSGIVLPLLARRARVYGPRRARDRGARRSAERVDVGRRGSALSFHGMSGKVAPPAETSRPAPPQPAPERDVRASRLYVLSRGPISSARAARVLRGGARRPRRRRARSRDLPRARHPPGRHRRRRRPLGPAVARGAGRVAEVRRADHGARLRAGGPVPPARAAAGSRAHPRVPHRRRAHRARLRDRDGLRLLDVGPHPDVRRRVGA